jgi:hypothetical protein
MAQNDPNQGGDVRDSRIVDPAAETPTRARNASAGPLIDQPQTEQDRGGAELHIDEAAADADQLPPPSAHRADTMVRAVGPDARQEMERGGGFRNQASFTKGQNAPTTDQSRLPYTVEQMDEMLQEAPRGLFPDTPGGDGATPLSADRNNFLATMGERGHFPSQRETERWARAVFNVLRQHAIEQDDALTTEFAVVVRPGEAPEVQVEEMMWGGDFLDRMSRALSVASTWTRHEFYEQVAEEARETADDPWVDAAVHSFLSTLKSFLGDTADRISNLGELQEIWDRV